MTAIFSRTRQMQHPRFGIRFESDEPPAAAHTRFLEATEGNVRRRTAMRIDPDRTGFEPTRDVRGTFRVPTPDRGAETEAGRVRAGHGFLDLGEGQQRQHRTE